MKRIVGLLVVALLTARLGAQNLELPPPKKSGGLPLMEALARRCTTREFDRRELPAAQLSSLLWACYGVNRPDGKRTAPSTRNAQEYEIFVVLSQAAYRYDATAHRLDLVCREDLRALAATQAYATNAPVTLLFVADLAKLDLPTAEEKTAYARMDAGYISQNAYLYCASEGLATAARASVDRPALARKLQLRPEQIIMLAQSVAYPKP